MIGRIPASAATRHQHLASGASSTDLAPAPQTDELACLPPAHTTSAVAQLKRRELGQPVSKVFVQRWRDLEAIDRWETQTKQGYPAEQHEQHEHITKVAKWFREHACEPNPAVFRMQSAGFSTSVVHVGFLKNLPPIPANTRKLYLDSATNLEAVDFSHCDSEKLESVEIILCNLQEPPDLSRFQKIRHINLSQNSQMRGHLNVAHHPNLRVLQLDFCSALDGLSELSENPELHQLSLMNAGHLLASMPAVFSNSKLEDLMLDECPEITHLPNFKACTALKKLSMLGCGLPHLPDDFCDYPASTEVRLTRPPYPQLTPSDYVARFGNRYTKRWPQLDLRERSH
jgi:hypothetical protein